MEKIDQIVSNVVQTALTYYSRVRIFNFPWLGAIYTAFKNKHFSYDKHLIRRTFKGNDELYLEDSFKNKTTSVLIGSSALWGAYSSSDKTTLSSYLSSKVGRDFINMGFGGSITLQNIFMLSSLLYKYCDENNHPKDVIIYSFNNDIYMMNKINQRLYGERGDDIFNSDPLIPIKLLGFKSKYTLYTDLLEKEKEQYFKLKNINPKDASIKQEVQFYSVEYLRNIKQHGLTDKNDYIEIMNQLVKKVLSQLDIDYFSYTSRTKFIVDMIKILLQSEEFTTKIKTDDVFRNCFKPVELELMQSFSILYSLQRRFKFNIHMFYQPQMFKMTYLYGASDTQYLIADKLLSMEAKQNSNILKIEEITEHILPILFKDEINTRIQQLAAESGLNARFNDLNTSKELGSKLMSDQIPLFTDNAHMTDMGFEAVADILISNYGIN